MSMPQEQASGEGASSLYSPATRRLLLGDPNMARAIVALVHSYTKPKQTADTTPQTQTHCAHDTQNQEPK